MLARRQQSALAAAAARVASRAARHTLTTHPTRAFSLAAAAPAASSSARAGRQYGPASPLRTHTPSASFHSHSVLRGPPVGTVADLPLVSLGSGVRSALVERWHARVGEVLRQGQPIAVVRTETARAEIQAPCDAKVLALLYEEGQQAIVGRPFVRLQVVSTATDSQRPHQPDSTTASANHAGVPPSILSIVRMERALVRARQQGVHVSPIVAQVMRMYNDAGMYERTIDFHANRVKQEEAAGDREIAVQYWRAHDAIEERDVRAAQQRPASSSTSQSRSHAASSHQPHPSSSSQSPSASPAVPPVVVWPPGRDPPVLYVRGAGADSHYKPIFSTRALFTPDDAPRQQLFLWLLLVPLAGLFAWACQDFVEEHTKDLNAQMKDLHAKLNKTFPPAEVPKTKLSDVCGCEEAKAEMTEIVEYLKNPEKFTKLGGKMPKGLLLLGPPGTGKTLLARAVAGEAGVPFYAVSGSDFEEQYSGLGAKRVRDLFAAARKLKRAIIFIDEIDSIGGRRETYETAGHEGDRQVLNQLLSELDGYVQNTGVIVVAATNHAETLDSALLRPGRFDRHIVVDLPDIAGRKSILNLYGARVKLDPRVDLGSVAKSTAGMSGADLAQLINQAALRASALNKALITPADIEYAVDTVQLGLAKSSSMLSKEMRRHLAFYHAGRSLVSLHTRDAVPVHKVTIMQRGANLGTVSFQYAEDEDKTSQRYSEMLAQLDLFMGGRVAEEIVYGQDEVTSHAGRDLAQAQSLARSMVMQYGFGQDHGPVSNSPNDHARFAEGVSDHTKRSIDHEVRVLLDNSLQRARKLLQARRTELDRVADALLQHETLDAQELKAVAAGKQIVKAAPAADS